MLFVHTILMFTVNTETEAGSEIKAWSQIHGGNRPMLLCSVCTQLCQ